jgi:large subunit ribosomal protein L19e
MNLKKKKELAAKTLGVGKNRVSFNPEGLNDIKEAITKQDIITHHEEGIITIKPIKGRKTIVVRKRKRGPGKIKMKIKNRKQDYVKITRKLRKYLKGLKNQNEIGREAYYDIRKKIKMRTFKNLSYLKEYVESLKKTGKTDDGKKKTEIKEKPTKTKNTKEKK